MSNTITAYFKGRVGVAESVYQNDYGIVMAFDSIDLPAHFECFFSKLNQEEAVPGLGADSRVAIPNSVLADPGNVTIHIPLHTGEDDSEVEYVVYFKVIGRARPIDDGTPVQMTAIERALALLSQPLTNIEEIVNEALSFTGTTIAELQAEESAIKGRVTSLETDNASNKSRLAYAENDIDSLEGQIATAISALTVDSEVQNVRVGDDGITYDTAGNAVRKQFADVKRDLLFVGKDNLEYSLASRSISGTSPWNGPIITMNFIPEFGKTYYLHIDSVTNCMTSVCARLSLFVDSTGYSYKEMTVEQVNNHESISIKIDAATINKMTLTLYRNYSASAVAEGTTVFSGVRITTDTVTPYLTMKENVDLTQNEDYKKVVAKGYAWDKLNVIDLTDNGFVAEPMSWLTNRYAFYFGREVFVKSLNPTFSATGQSVTYYIKRLSTDTVEDGAIATLVETITGTTGTAVELNRTLKKNEIIEVSCSGAYFNTAETRYVRNNYHYAPWMCYVTAENAVSQVSNWSHMRAYGVFEVYETESFWDEYYNYWFGKRIVWFGTSIPEGGYAGDKRTAYPAIIGKKLGAAVFNEAVGSSSISRTHPSFIAANNPYGIDTTDFEFAARCLGDNLTIKQWLIDNYNGGYFTTNVPASMTESLQNTIKGYSYENKVDRYLSGGDVGEVDLYVFDQGYNDDFVGGYRDVEALEEQYGIDTTYCFDGGMNFLIRRILTSNPDAKIIIISHYTNNAPCGNQVNDSHVKAVCAAQKAVADRWGIKFINLYEQLGWSGQIITTTGYWDSTTHEWVNSGGASQQISVKNMHVRDKTHPFTDASGKSNIKIAEVLASEIESLYK